MYRLYLEKCEVQSQTPVKEHLYRTIFNTEFNLDFHSPKKDRCDRCEEFRMKEKYNLLDDNLKAAHTQHIESKQATKTERDKDRQGNYVTVCFDLQNVITCPRANISSFFYRRKLSVYNLTAHCNLNSAGYCAIWHEQQAGRGANEIASALVAILERIDAEHHPDSITLWSDSCVPQNRNSGMAFAMIDFIKGKSVSSIQQKFCEPGHSSIQEVDNIHSHLEKQLSASDVFSPLGVMKSFKRAMRKPISIIQMKDNQFKKYLEASRNLDFKHVPFSKVKSLKYSDKDLFGLAFKKSFEPEAVWGHVSLRKREMSVKRMSSPPRSPTSVVWPLSKQVSGIPKMSKEKAADIRAMLKFMTPTDKRYMSGLIS